MGVVFYVDNPKVRISILEEVGGACFVKLHELCLNLRPEKWNFKGEEFAIIKLLNNYKIWVNFNTNKVKIFVGVVYHMIITQNLKLNLNLCTKMIIFLWERPIFLLNEFYMLKICKFLNTNAVNKFFYINFWKKLFIFV